jgi:vitellogenic carboxypeptidase-like protein
MENGPMTVNSKGKLETRAQPWTDDHHMLYIDNPVGAGFSYTNNTAGYAKNENDVGANLFSAVRQFFLLFPDLFKNRFYVTGESYAGKYVPAIAYTIYSKKSSSDPADRINLRGIAIGNGVTDPVHQINFGDYYYNLGFIDKNALATFNQFQNAALSYIAQGNYVTAMEYAFYLINSQGCLFNNLTGFTSPYNYLLLNGYNDKIDLTSNFIMNSGIAAYLHVGKRPFVPFTDSNIVLQNLVGDIMVSVAPWVQTLADNYKVFIYNGMLDLLIGATNTENYLSYLSYSGASEFSTAPRSIWKVGNDVAGYWKKGGNLYHISVRNAGHMVPVDQPVWAYDLVKRLTFETFF